MLAAILEAEDLIEYKKSKRRLFRTKKMLAFKEILSRKKKTKGEQSRDDS
jgi:hypothetical protein